MIANNIFGLEERALKLSELRATVLANNIANASTPHFKARDFDFQSALTEASAHFAVTTTHANHLQVNNAIGGQPLGYRTPMQTSLDGNTVDDELERKNFINNSIQYQASLSFVQQRLNTLLHAIKGE